MKKQTSTRILVLGGLSAAIVAAFTFIQLPIGITNGYVNLGDVAIFAIVYLFSDLLYPSVSAGIGSALVDILCGYAIYAPGTLIIKASTALVASIARNCKTTAIKILILIVAASIIPIGYFLYELLLGYGIAASLASMLMNSLQAAIGLLGGSLLGNIFVKIRHSVSK